jgi:ATP-dependent helicase/nuclease subunit A
VNASGSTSSPAAVPARGTGASGSPVTSGSQLALTFATEAPSAPQVAPTSLRGLTEEQELAIARRHGSLLLAAGAGSGKTSVLVERFVRAVLEDGVAPSRILAITFTERAAGELKERVRARFMALEAREAARDTEAALIGTFHGFCARLLRTHPLLAELDPEFTILDEPLAGRLRTQAFSGALGAFVSQPGSLAVDLVAAHGADRLRAMVLGVYAQLRSQGHAQPALPPIAEDWPEALDAEGARACALLDSLLRDFAARYANLKRERSGLDFDDLELRARALLEEHEAVRRSWSERLQLLMVDEFQDTNPRQLAVLMALERENLFTVGDELQSIYGFRHADVGLFRARRARLAERDSSLALTWNFRSRPSLLAAINAVFATRFGAAFTPLIAGREVRETGGASDGGEEPPIELLLSDRRSWNGGAPPPGAPRAPGELPGVPRWRHAEARLLAHRIAELVRSGRARPGDIAVLLRSVGDLPLYQRALEERGLRTLAAVGSFWGHQQVGDLLAYLRVLANPLDELALHCTLASPLVGLSSDALALLARAAQSAGVGVWELIQRSPAAPLHERLASADRERLRSFAARLAAERACASARPLAELVRRALRATGYESYVLSLPGGERCLANLHKLGRLAVRFEAQEGRDLRAFLDHVAHQQDTMEGFEPEAPAGELEPQAVRLLSIHAAKGLEFPVVCLADLGRVPPTTSPALLVDGERVGLRLARLDGSDATPTMHYSDLLDARRRAEAEEEERILYVAMTRARDLLLLSGAVDFERWPAPRSGSRLAPAPIAWLAPALIEDLPARLAALERPVQVLPVNGAEGVSVRSLFHTPACAAALMQADPHAESKVDARGLAVHSPQPPPCPQPPVPHARPLPSSKKGFPPLPLSYTALSELERCGYRYYLERVLELPAHAEHGGGGLGARARGVLVHRLLQSIDFAAPPAEGEIERVARELSLQVSPRERRSLAELLRAACATALAGRLRGAGIRREHPFAFSLGPDHPLVTGVLDVLLVEPASTLVVDYKSDSVAAEEDLEALVQRHYGAQRLLYALVALRDGAPRVEVIHWFLARPEEWVCASFAAAEAPALERELLARAARVREAGFAVSPTPHRELCLTCPGRATLCSWSDDETLRERQGGRVSGGRVPGGRVFHPPDR